MQNKQRASSTPTPQAAVVNPEDLPPAIAASSSMDEVPLNTIANPTKATSPSNLNNNIVSPTTSKKKSHTLTFDEFLKNVAKLGGVIIAIASQLLLGTQPALAKYLQVHAFPPLTLIALTYICDLLVMIPLKIIEFVIEKARHKKQQQQVQLQAGDNEKFENSNGGGKSASSWLKRNLLTPVVQELTNPAFYIFSVATLGFTISMVIAVKNTKAMYMQLIMLSSPIMTEFLCITIAALHRCMLKRSTRRQLNEETEDEDEPYVLFDEEKLTFFTFTLIVASLLSGALVLVGGFADAPTPWYTFIYKYKLNLANLAHDLSAEAFGLIMALVTTIAVTIYFLILKFGTIRIKVYKKPSVVFGSGENVLILQIILHHIFIIPAVILEREQIMTKLIPNLTPEIITVFLLYAIVSNLGGVYAVILATRQLGPVIVGGLLPLRLVASIAVASLMLHEYMKTIWQAIGVVAVLVFITLFLLFKHRDSVHHQHHHHKIKHDDHHHDEVHDNHFELHDDHHHEEEHEHP